MNKKIEVFEDIENRGEYFVFGAKGPMEALLALEWEYPETKGVFKQKNAKEVEMHECLDCGIYWVSDDVCGECGEYRLSKRSKYAWNFCSLPSTLK